MDSDDRATFQWHGAAHYQIAYKDRKTLIDPLYTRLPGDKPPLVHHFDNFLNPYTLPKYIDLGDYRRILHERCPDARFYFSKFLREVDLSEIAGA